MTVILHYIENLVIINCKDLVISFFTMDQGEKSILFDIITVIRTWKYIKNIILVHLIKKLSTCTLTSTKPREQLRWQQLHLSKERTFVVVDRAALTCSDNMSTVFSISNFKATKKQLKETSCKTQGKEKLGDYSMRA